MKFCYNRSIIFVIAICKALGNVDEIDSSVNTYYYIISRIYLIID